MGLLQKLLGGSSKPPARPYVDRGFLLTKKLATLLTLSDWATGIPTFTKKESDAIDRELTSFQQIADEEAKARGAEKMLLHPEFVEPAQRMFGAQALRRLAGPVMDLDWDLDGDCPDDWKARVSTYLKAWAMDLCPDALLNLGRLLVLAGYRGEAREAAAIVAECFPTYAPRLYGGASSDTDYLIRSFTQHARELIQEIDSDPRKRTAPEETAEAR